MRLCGTVEEFELEERRDRRERAVELFRRGLSIPQVTERLGLSAAQAAKARRLAREEGR